MRPYDNLDEAVARNQCVIASLCGDFNGGARHKNLCVLSVVIGFAIGLGFGIFLPVLCAGNDVTFKGVPTNDSLQVVPAPITFLEPDHALIEDGIYWGFKVEDALPRGYLEKTHDAWSSYVRTGVAVKLGVGCGRMQNRLLSFADGRQGCVRYRQNTDQIQGELFSFYLAQILKLPNLAPSAVTTIDLDAPLWRNLENDIAAAQWHSNRPVVITQYISNLDSANIPALFKPIERHLNKFDVYNMTGSKSTILKNLVELAQWSDLIIFDYLTANLDRIVNNLYNYQWNANIMDAPAHNLAKKLDSDLLLFLDNESGLLHGYRLLKKYEIYHTLLLENLCLFRRPTVDAIRNLKKHKNVGHLLRTMFETRNNPRIKDVLPSLPEKSIKTLNERIEKVHNQILKCESIYNCRKNL